MSGPDSRLDGELGALHAELSSLRQTAAHTAAGVWHWGPTGETIFANRAMCVLLEIEDPEALCGRSAFEFFTEPALRDLFSSHVPGVPATYDVDLVGARGTRRRVHIAVATLPSPGNGPTATVATFSDLTREQEVTDELRKANERLDLALEAAQMALFDWDIADDRVEASFSGRVMSFQGSLRDAITRGLSPESREHVVTEIDQALADPTCQAFNMEYQAQLADGETGWRMATARVLRNENGTPFRLVGASLDINQRKTLQLRLEVAERMESLGRLSGGIAHEFNNLLAVIVGSSAFARGTPTRADEALTEIDEAARRATRITRQLLAFASRQPMERLVVDLSAIVDSTCDWLRGALGDEIEVVSQVGPGLTMLDADPAQLEHVVMQLAANAREAMPDGGTLTITLERDGQALALTMADTGAGMDAATRERATEPFFTTKPNSAGLGLAASYGIVAQLGGELTLRSTEGEGTMVEVRLPAAPDDTAGRDSAPPLVERPRREATLLVVDDEEALRRVMERFLTLSGYRVRMASNGDEALTLLDDDIDLVLSDIRMPGMNGSVLAEHVRALRPELPIVLMSGYTEHAVDRADGTVFVAKPFDPAVLIELIDTLLTRP